MTEDELLDEITLISTAIQHIYKTGQKYEIGTGPSKRVFEAASYKDLTEERRRLQIELQNVQNCGGGVVLGF